MYRMRFAVASLVFLCLSPPAHSVEEVAGRGAHCDRKCQGARGHIVEADQEEPKSDKGRPAVLTRDDHPSAGVGRPGIGADYKPKERPPENDDFKPPTRDSYEPKPPRERDAYEPLKPTRDGEPYEPPKPSRNRDSYEPPKPTRDRDTYEPPKPTRDRDTYEPPKPTRDRDTYEPPKPTRNRDSYEPPKPTRDRDFYEPPKPTRNRDSYEPSKPTRDRDTYEPPKPTRDRDTYEPPKPTRDRDTYEPPKPTRDRDTYEPPKPTRDRDTYEPPKPTRDRDTYEPPKPTRDRDIYEPPKPIQDRDSYEPPKPKRDRHSYEPSKATRDRDSYEPPKPTRDRDSYEPPKPTRNRDSYEPPKPTRNRDSYEPRPERDRDAYIPKPTRESYEPKPEKERDSYEPRPSRGRDSYEPRPPSRDRDSYEPKPVIYKDPYESESPNIPRHGGGYVAKPKDDGYDSSRPFRGGHIPKPAEFDYRHEPTPKPLNDKDDYPPRPVGGGGYNPKPVNDKDDYPPRPVGGGGYNPKPVNDKDDYPPRPVGEGGYNPKPVNDKDDYPPKPVEGGGNNPKTINGKDDYPPRPVGSGGYNPRPVTYDDDHAPRPIRGGGYDPRPFEDDYAPRPVGGYKPRPVTYEDDHLPRPVEEGGGYKPRPVKDKDDHPPRPVGGYNPNLDDDKARPAVEDDYVPRPIGEDRVGKCFCVPYYQCTDGHIVTDGAGIIDARRKPDDDEDNPLDGEFSACGGPIHVCCSAPESSTVRPFQHKCGRRNPNGINPQLLSPANKGEADFGEWPWQAAVLKSDGKVNIFMCGGVLIDKQHVLTVAHCVFHLAQEGGVLPLKVRLGEWDTQTNDEFLAHEDYNVSRVVLHPEFRNTSLWNDLAVLRLDEPVLFDLHIATVCLPKADEIFTDHNCVVTGWGKDAYRGGTFSNVMKEVAIRVLDSYKCEELLRKTRLGTFFQLHEGFLCAGGEPGTDSCKGDGGGPLVCYRKDRSYALAGIVSWGIECGHPDVPGVYVKIQKYVDWISLTTGLPAHDYWPN